VPPVTQPPLLPTRPRPTFFYTYLSKCFAAFHDLLLPPLRAAVCAAASATATGDHPTATAATTAPPPSPSPPPPSSSPSSATAPTDGGRRLPSTGHHHERWSSVGSGPQTRSAFQLDERVQQPGPFAGGAIAPAKGADVGTTAAAAAAPDDKGCSPAER